MFDKSIIIVCILCSHNYLFIYTHVAVLCKYSMSSRCNLNLSDQWSDHVSAGRHIRNSRLMSTARIKGLHAIQWFSNFNELKVYFSWLKTPGRKSVLKILILHRVSIARMKGFKQCALRGSLMYENQCEPLKNMYFIKRLLNCIFLNFCIGNIFI